jgi:chromate transporter
VQGALRGMSAVAAGMITATGLKMLPALKKNVIALPWCWTLAGLTFVAIAWLRVPLIWVLAVLGGGSGIWAYRRLNAMQQSEPKP